MGGMFFGFALALLTCAVGLCNLRCFLLFCVPLLLFELGRGCCLLCCASAV